MTIYDLIMLLCLTWYYSKFWDMEKEIQEIRERQTPHFNWDDRKTNGHSNLN